MKKSLIALIIGGLVLLSGGLVWAQTVEVAPKDIDPLKALDTIIDIVFTVLISVAVLFLIIAGFYFVTASGNPEQLGKARNMVMWAIVGVVVALLARGIVTFIKTWIGLV